jgi:hypothetical protein
MIRLPNWDLFCAPVSLKAMIAVVIAAGWTCLGGCVSSGFYQMSDDWCMRHPEASVARCGPNQGALAQAARTDGSQTQSNGP